MPRATANWEHIPCDYCGGLDAVVLHRVAAQQSGIGAEMTLVRCSSCSLVYLNPRPSEQEIGMFYPTGYYAHSNMNGRQKRLRARLRDRFLNALGGYGNALDQRLIKAFNPISLVDVIIPETRRGRLLDVGCGDGERAYWYSKRGFEAYGVEVSSRAVKNARNLGIHVRQGTLESAEFPDAFFDVVIMGHVLEHTHSPQKCLKETFRILKPGGMLAIAVPNIEAHTALVYGQDWAFLMLPIHLYHFSVATLSAYLTRSGFCIESMNGKLVYPRMVRSSHRNFRTHSPAGASVKAWVSSGVLASEFARMKKGISACDTITAYCIRPPKVTSVDSGRLQSIPFESDTSRGNLHDGLGS